MSEEKMKQKLIISSAIFKRELTVSVCFYKGIARSNLHFICIIIPSGVHRQKIIAPEQIMVAFKQIILAMDACLWTKKL